MLPREQFKALTDRIQETHNAGGNEALQAEMQRGRQIFARIGWGGNETSMVNSETLPYINDMLRRLREKYANVLQAKSVDGVLQDLEKFLNAEITKAKAAKDNDRVFDLQKALNTLIAKDSILRRQDNPPELHGTNIREALALVWLAASDVKMVLPPIRERELLKLKEDERQAARQKIVMEESINNIFILTLKEIRRAHNADTPERQRDLVKDYPSCAGGTFGRLIMNAATLNCVAAITTETGLSPQDVEAASKHLASLKAADIDFSCLPRLCEDFISEILKYSPENTREAMYRSFNEFINADLDEIDGNSENYQTHLARLTEYKRLHKLFADELNTDEVFEQFQSYIDHKMPDLFQALRASKSIEQLREIYQEYAKSLLPENLFSKDFFIVYRNQDQRFIDDLRKHGREITKVSEVGNTIFRDPDIIQARIRIHNLYERLSALHQLIMNEAKFALLAYGALSKTIAGENNEKWLNIIDQIQRNIQTYCEEIRLNLKPELAENHGVLKQLLENKLREAESQTDEALHENIKLCQDQFESINARTSKTANKCNELISGIESVATIIDKTSNLNRQGRFKVREINGALLPLMMIGNNNELINGTDKWAQVLLEIAGTKLPSSEVRKELNHFIQFMNLCGDDSMEAEIVKTIPSAFKAMLKNPSNIIDWPSRFKAIKLIEELFPDQGILRKCDNQLRYIDWAKEIIKVSQSKDLSKNEKASYLKAIHQHIVTTYTEAEQREILNAIGVEFSHTCTDTKTAVTWRERRDSIQLLINEFRANDPALAPGENIGLKFQALCGFKELEESGRDVLDEQSQAAFECAAKPLILAKYEPDMSQPERISSDTFQANFNAWLEVGRELLGVDTKSFKPNAELDIRKLEQFVILSFCRNMGLTDMRYADMDILRKICRKYMKDDKDISNVMFDLDQNDTLDKRLNYLAIHMACMITSLKPLAAPYNTGHVRIMDMSVASGLRAGKNNLCIVRTSSRNPATLTVTANVKGGHYRIEGNETVHNSVQTAQTLKDISIQMSDNTQHKIPTFYLFNYHCQDYLFKHSIPELVLTPFNQLLLAEQELKAEFKRDEGIINCRYAIIDFNDSSGNVPVARVAAQPANLGQNDNNTPTVSVARNPATAFHHGSKPPQNKNLVEENKKKL